MLKKGLGKGLGSIIPGANLTEDKNRIAEIDVDLIIPNPDQPRKFFDEKQIQELADSIKINGLIQPIIVRTEGVNFILVAGERRWRATKLAGLNRIKAITIKAGEEDHFTLALVENIQRSDLNPIEEAKAYDYLINKFNLKQQEVASKVSKSRASIANSLRLLNLPQVIQIALIENKITVGHAKILLSITNPEEQKNIYSKIISEKISVRDLEQITARQETKNSANSKNSLKRKNADIKKMEEELISLLGTKVEIKHSGQSGKIEISYYSLDDFDRLVDIFKG